MGLPYCICALKSSMKESPFHRTATPLNEQEDHTLINANFFGTGQVIS